MSATSSVNNKQIAKNTLFLYIREFITLFIAFFTTRLLLGQLGVDDFGMYGLIGSVLTIFSSLRGLFATSIQRFINIEKGTGNSDRVNRIFSLGVAIHVALALLFIAVAEVMGLLFIPTLNIPTGSVQAAYWVLQFSIFATAVAILTIPYDALIIANERFSAFAVFSIIESVLKLIIIFLLAYSPFQKVIVYSFALLMLAVIIRSLNAIYCKRAFKEEARFRWVNDRLLLRQMTVFAGWQFFGNLAFSLMNAGMNFVINLFGGVAVNAARTIAYQTMTAVTKFTGSVGVSFQPQSMRLYSQGNHVLYFKLMLLDTKVSFLVTAILGSVVVLMAPSLLRLWLGNVPEYTTEMVQSIFVYAIVRSLHTPIDTLFKAAGRLKYYQLSEFVLLSSSLPLSWWLLYERYPYHSVFFLMAVVELANLFAILWLASRLLSFDSKRYMILLFPRCMILFVLFSGIFVALPTTINAEVSVLGTLFKSLMIGLASLSLSLLVLFDKEELRHLSKLLPFLK
ncbi:polysaccharide biosynthesis protein [Parabacteroides sp.]|uniref:polysaccharide biosynthesis protein n=1 Tax=Parabacteroides sp. TaxID=1869337 RepID=UPI00257B63E2|nr:polysaccharide biosynthesis protein [Parabacteroides sp.]